TTMFFSLPHIIRAIYAWVHCKQTNLILLAYGLIQIIRKSVPLKHIIVRLLQVLVVQWLPNWLQAQQRWSSIPHWLFYPKSPWRGGILTHVLGISLLTTPILMPIRKV